MNKKWMIGTIMTVAALAQVPAWANVATVKSSGWKKLKKVLPQSTLLEGTYRGTGLRTGDEYILHLLGYLDRDDSFIAVAEDTSHPHMALGFLQRSATGDYLWYPMHVDTQRPGEMANPLLSSPIVDLSFGLDRGGSTSSITATSLSNSPSENIEFSTARRLELKSSLASGGYSLDATQINLTPSRLGGSQPQGGTTLWDARVSNNGSDSPIASGAYLVREEYPGVFTFNATRMNGYVADVDPGISYVAVSFVDPGIFSDTTQLVAFKVSGDGYLQAIPGKFELSK